MSNETVVTIVTDGDDSDYMVLAVLEWLRPETPEQARDLWLEIHPDQRKGCSFESYSFLAWLVANGYAIDLEAQELHLSDYSGLRAWKRKPFRRIED